MAVHALAPPSAHAQIPIGNLVGDGGMTAVQPLQPRQVLSFGLGLMARLCDAARPEKRVDPETKARLCEDTRLLVSFTQRLAERVSQGGRLNGEQNAQLRQVNTSLNRIHNQIRETEPGMPVLMKVVLLCLGGLALIGAFLSLGRLSAQDD